MNKVFAIIIGLFLMSFSTAHAIVFHGTPSGITPTPLFGTLIDFDDQATGTVVGAGDYSALGLASVTETTGGILSRYTGSQSVPNYIGTGAGYETGGSSASGWDGTFLFEFANLADMVGIGIANSIGDAEILTIFDSSWNVLDTTTALHGSNTYIGFDLAGSYDIKYLQVECDFCALDDLQFTATVQEPGILFLISAGLIGLGLTRRKA